MVGDGSTTAKLVIGSSGLSSVLVSGMQRSDPTEVDRERWRDVYGREIQRGEEPANASPWGIRDVQVFTVDLPTDPETTVVFESKLAGDARGFACGRDAPTTRHPLVSRSPRSMKVLYYAAGEAWTDLIVDLPSHWRSQTRSGERQGSRRRFSNRIEQAPHGWSSSFRSSPRLSRGGPLVGVGIDLGDGPRPRFRAGYEFAAPRWVIYGVAAESDLRSLSIIPTIEIASPSFFILPSIGVGVGAPVRVVPEPAAGVRTVATLSWPVVSLVGTFDAFPAQNGRGRDFLGGLMLQASI